MNQNITESREQFQANLHWVIEHLHSHVSDLDNSEHRELLCALLKTLHATYEVIESDATHMDMVKDHLNIEQLIPENVVYDTEFIHQFHA